MKKVAIVGAQELTREKAPFGDTEYDIWSFADWICSSWLKRCTGLFEIHLPNVYMNHPRTPQYWDTLQKTEIPVWMYPVADPRVPGSVLFPMQEILDMIALGKTNGERFKPLNSSVAYAMALAIYLEYEVIDVYGVEMAHSSEYMSQQPIFAFWSGVAVGKGIQLNINCSQGLFVQPLYGLEDVTETAKIYSMMEAIKKQIADAEKIKLMGDGALQLARNLVNTRGVYE